MLFAETIFIIPYVIITWRTAIARTTRGSHPQPADRFRNKTGGPCGGAIWSYGQEEAEEEGRGRGKATGTAQGHGHKDGKDFRKAGTCHPLLYLRASEYPFADQPLQKGGKKGNATNGTFLWAGHIQSRRGESPGRPIPTSFKHIRKVICEQSYHKFIQNVPLNTLFPVCQRVRIQT